MKILKMKDLDFVCEVYDEKTDSLNFDHKIFWDFCEKAHEKGLEITVKGGAYNADFNFDISGKFEIVKDFIIENYLGGDAVLFEEHINDAVEIIEA